MAVNLRSYTTTAPYGSSTNCTLTPPAGLTNNDILIAFIAAGAPGIFPEIAAPAGGGWTQIGPTLGVQDWATFGMRVSLYWKRASSESGNYVFTTNNGEPCSQQGLLMAFSGCPTNRSPIDVFNYGSGSMLATGTTPSETHSLNATVSSITTTINNDMVVFIASDWGDWDAITPSANFADLYNQTGVHRVIYAQGRSNFTLGSTGDVTVRVNNEPYPWTAYMFGLVPADSTPIFDFTAHGFTTTSPALDTTPAFNSTPLKNLLSSSLTISSPTLGAPSITPKIVHALSPSTLTAGVPVLPTASLSARGNLIIANLSAGSPVPGAPLIGQRHVILSSSFVDSGPTLNAAALLSVTGDLFISNRVTDFGMISLTQATHLHLLGSQITTYAELAGQTLGNSPVTMPGIAANLPFGRRIDVPEIVDGTVTAQGFATMWALVDATNSRLLATGRLGNFIETLAGYGFLLDPFSITLLNE